MLNTVCWGTATLLTVGTAFAQSPNVDWKYYSAGTTDREQIMCFYDAQGVRHGPQGHVRVWTKCLRQKDVEAVDIKKDFGGAILENTARKVASYYIPPIATVIETIDVNQMMAITKDEETADISDIPPLARIFYELNCPDRMMRELSISIDTDNGSGSVDKPGDWKNIPPEGGGAFLLKILCPAE